MWSVTSEERFFGTSMRVVACPSCGEEEDLMGARSGDTIEIMCGGCGHKWLRDSTRKCPSCGRSDLREFQEPLVQRARGTAYSIVGARSIHLCPVCDADEIARRSPSREHPSAPREDPWK